jgi:methylenetetrahydrofolate dehydrogenase (NADP+)/methenyltetrahydrofolate cyclohydrolase
MTAQVLNGKEIAREFCEGIKTQVSELKEKSNIVPRIALINASDDPASEIYVANKTKLAASLGIDSIIYKFNNSVKQKELIELIRKLNADENTHAILLQSPIHKHLRFRELVNFIHPDKDVDGLTTLNQGRLFSGEPGIVPCTPLGVMHLLHMVHEKLEGLHAVVLGRSSIVGRPLSQLLLNANCTVTLLHSHSVNLQEICNKADILVSAIGKPEFIGASFIKPGATVIDVGISRIEKDGKKKVVGDVDFELVNTIAGTITPVPNGVGPMTVAYLMHNTFKIACGY